MKIFAKIMIIIVIIIVTIKVTFLYPAVGQVREKITLIESEVINMGYTPNWVIISEKRSEWYNSILKNSAKNSYHLKGMAIDIFIFDVDGNNKFTYDDIRIIERANDIVERKNPNLKGGFGTYMKSGQLSKRMVHIDVRGYKKRFFK